MKYKKLIISILFLIFELNLNAQEGIEFYRSIENVNYWANRKPNPSYWQQDVYYKIKAVIDTKTDIISGDEHLTYFNNSPDTLYFVYFHLYQNAFRPNSDLAKLYGKGGRKVQFGKYEKEGKNIEISKIQSQGKDLKTELNGTIQKVWLAKPLLPNESYEFEIEFKTYFERNIGWRRMSCFEHNGQLHYNGAHWYPRISVYDQKFGWTADQHMGHEFYGDFGVYEVELQLPDNFIVGATGELTNRNEVLPTEFFNKIRISNASGKIESNGFDGSKNKTWKYVATNVHDFAFIADPSYRLDVFTIELKSGKKVDCWAYAMAENAHQWKDASYVCAKIIEYYSNTFGDYAYNSMIVADAESGMEYPMLTMNRGNSPDYAYIFAHEIGHNWFFGAVGNNETYSAFLDEGFTQFLTIKGLEELQKTMAISSKQIKKCFCTEYEPLPVIYTAAYSQYLKSVQKEGGQQLNTHSDYFNTADTYGNAYRQTYYKGAVMLFNLQYVLGDSLFNAALNHYYSQWKFCHPYPEDFRNSIISFTHIDLNWFFDQWITTKKTLDYSIHSVRRKAFSTQYTITFKRKGEMQMPIDFTIMTIDSQYFNYHIPNREFVKSTNSTVLPTWFGWDLTNKTYSFSLTLPDKIKTIRIDTSLRFADMNMLNNSKPFPAVLRFDNGMILDDIWTSYTIDARPDLWWSSYNGMKVGLHFDAGYLNYKHKISGSVWFNTAFQSRKDAKQHMKTTDIINWQLNYQTPLSKIWANPILKLGFKNIDGLKDFRSSFLWKNKTEKHTFEIQLKSMYRTFNSDNQHLIYPEEWSLAEDSSLTKFNNKIDFGYTFNFKGGKLKIDLISSVFLSSFDYSSLVLELKHEKQIKKTKLKSRLFAQVSAGAEMPKESQLYLAGANPEEMMESKFYRSSGFFPQTNYGRNIGNFQMGGGLNLRAYSNYLSVNDTGINQSLLYRSHSGFACNFEYEFGKLIPIRFKKLSKYVNFTPYIFADAAIISTSEISSTYAFAKPRADAGIGFVFSIINYGKYDKIKPLHIRFDFPLYLSNTPFAEPDDFKFRWIMAINRAF